MKKRIIIGLIISAFMLVSCSSDINKESNIAKAKKLSISDNVLVSDVKLSEYNDELFKVAQIYMDKKDVKEEDLIDFAINKLTSSEFTSLGYDLYTINLGNNKGIVFINPFIVAAYYGEIDELGRLISTERVIEIYEDGVKHYTLEEGSNK